MLIRVLGSSAGGGFPQWNCACANCDGLRRGRIRATPRTQSSIAVSGDGRRWVLVNASPDVLTQIRAAPYLQPGRAPRDTGIAAIILVDAQIDHTTGLLMLREGKALEVYCTDAVAADLTGGHPLFRVLPHFCGVNRHGIDPRGAAFEVPGVPFLRFSAVALRSAAPPYSPHRADPRPGDNIGLTVEDIRSGRKLFYAPGLGEIEPRVAARMEEADCLTVDGTFWTDDELIRLGISDKRARDIGHLPQSGAGGMIEVLEAYPRARRILIHINNTNPILDVDSAQRAELARNGIEVAFDRMAIEL